jgi:glyoxylase-like metal-dependent hydrolase (beta-lactamase superfamily II)
VLLVDAGWDRAAGLEGLERSLGTFGAAVADVRGVLFTHAHRDHYALGDLLRDASGAWLALHEAERSTLTRDVDVLERYFADLGLPLDELGDAVESALWMWGSRPAFEPDRRLRDGEVVAGLRVLHTPGHAPGHACFVAEERGVVFSGDHVLSRTTPNVSVFAGSAGSPLDDYLRALAATRSLAGLLALPGHEERCDLAARSTELLAHHDRQLRHAAKLVADGRDTVRAAAEAMEWTTPWAALGTLDRQLALGETYAHLLVLEHSGVLERISEKPLRWGAARR